MNTAQKIVAWVKGEVGYREGYSGGHWNNKEKYAAMVPGMDWVSDEGQPWCAVFNCAADYKAGLKPNVDFPNTASCDVAGDWFKREGRWSEYPAVGAWILFGTPSDLSHTGRVVKYDDTHVWTVEGNTNDSGSREGNGVYAKQYPRSSSRIIGYGYPKFDEGIDSADPKWADEKPAAPAKPTAPKPQAPKPTTPVKPAAPKPAPKPREPWKPANMKLRAGLHEDTKPGGHGPQVRLLQWCLRKAGYGQLSDSYDGVYGPKTEAAVADFHERNPRFKSYGKKRDFVIGEAGWRSLQKQAGLR